MARGATVVATASAANQDYLREIRAIPILYGDGLAERLLLQVDPDDATAGRPVPRAQFMAGVDEPRRDPTGAKRFDSTALSVAADGSTATAVEASVASTAVSSTTRPPTPSTGGV